MTALADIPIKGGHKLRYHQLQMLQAKCGIKGCAWLGSWYTGDIESLWITGLMNTDHPEIACQIDLDRHLATNHEDVEARKRVFGG